VELLFIALIDPSKGLLRDITSLERSDVSVVEGVPVRFAIRGFPVADEGVIVTIVSHAIVHYHTLQFVHEVLRGYFPIEYN